MQCANTTLVVLYPKVGPGFGHFQLPVVLSAGEALEAEHLPGVIEACLMWWDRTGTGCQMLRPAVLLGQGEVSVGRARIKGQRASVYNEAEGKRELMSTLFTYVGRTDLLLLFLLEMIYNQKNQTIGLTTTTKSTYRH